MENETEQTPDASAPVTESIEQFEARIATEGLGDAAPAESAEVQADESETEVGAADVAAEASTSAEKPDRFAEILAAQAEATKRQTELLEKIASRDSTPVKEAPKPPSMEEQYRAILADPGLMKKAMLHDQMGMDPTDPGQVAVFRTMVYNAILEEQSKALDAKVKALDARLAGWETSQQKQAVVRTVESEWTSATKDYDLSRPEVVEAAAEIREAVNYLIENGSTPKDAIATMLNKWGKLLPKKSTQESTQNRGRSPEAARGLAVAAMSSKGANRNPNGTFKRGTTTNESMNDFERSFLSN